MIFNLTDFKLIIRLVIGHILNEYRTIFYIEWEF